MLGHLIKQNEQWMVKYDDSGTNKIYPLCAETQKWTQKPEIKNFLKENISNELNNRHNTKRKIYLRSHLC